MVTLSVHALAEHLAAASFQVESGLVFIPRRDYLHVAYSPVVSSSGRRRLCCGVCVVCPPLTFTHVVAFVLFECEPCVSSLFGQVAVEVEAQL